MPPAGFPPFNSTFFCLDSDYAKKCYAFNPTPTNFDLADQDCSNLGGAMVLYTSSQEQLDVENYFITNGDHGAAPPPARISRPPAWPAPPSTRL